MRPVTCRTIIERHHPKLPRFVIVPIDVPRVFQTTTTPTVSGTLSGTPLDRRALKPWGDGRWFMDLPDRLCKRAGVDVGDKVVLELAPVAEPVPHELLTALVQSERASRAWARMPPGQRRDLAEWVAAAKRDETRKRRVEAILSKLTGE